MTSKPDDLGQRSRYDLPAGTFDMFETGGVSGAGAGLGPLGAGLGAGLAATVAAAARRGVSPNRPAYLGEDEAVLACCHHAHEVAKAHGAKEVMLEHLVHALVRVPGAIAVLEDRGVHVEQLRRESANVISSEVPVENTTIVAQLRASKDFNTVMYLAAAAASRRDERATSVRDVLDALLTYDPRSRAARLIRRHANGGEIEDQVDPLREVRSVMERYAGEVRELRMTVSEMRASHLNQGSSALSLLDDRMRGMEKVINQIAQDVADERMLVEDRMKGVQDVLLSQRTDARNVGDKMAGMERMLSSLGSMGDRFGGMERAVSSIGAVAERVAGIERSVTGFGTGLGAFAERVGAMERALTALSTNGQGSAAVTKLVEQQRNDLVRIEQLVHVGLASVERTIEANRPVSGEAITGLGDRLQAMEASLESKLVDAAKMENALIERLRAFSTSIESQMMNAQRVWSGLTDRIAGVERSLSGQREEQAVYQRSVTQEIKALATGIEAATGRDLPGVGFDPEQMTALRVSMEGSRDGFRRIETAITDRVGGLEQRIAAMGGGITSMGNSFAPLQERLAGLERSLAVQRNDVSSINEALDTELDSIRKALLALSHAQQTLGTAIDEWRQNNSGDLSVISNRLGQLEKQGLALALPQPIAPVVTVPAISVPAQPQAVPVPAAATQNLPPFAVPYLPSSAPVSIVAPNAVPVPPMTAPAQPAMADRSAERYDRAPERVTPVTNGTPVAVPPAARPEFASTANLLDRVDRALKNRYNN